MPKPSLFREIPTISSSSAMPNWMRMPASVFLLPAQEVAPATDDDALRPVEGLQRCGEVTQTGHVGAACPGLAGLSVSLSA